MKPTINTLLVCCFLCALCFVKADEFEPGKAFPTNRISTDFSLSSFIKQRGPTTDWSLVVLLRGEQHYILNDKTNRELLSKPVIQGDVVVLDDVASSFLAWRRQNPESELNLFWKAHPELLDKALRYSSATVGASLTPSTAVSDPSKAQPSISSVNTPPVVQPAKSKIVDAKPTTSTSSEESSSSTSWSIIVVLIVAASGLLWLLLKRRS